MTNPDEIPALAYEDWLSYGVLNGWCTMPVCNTHDVGYLLPDEMEAFESGDDPCIPIVRLWDKP